MASRVLKSPNSTGIEFASAGAPLHVSELDGDLDAIFNSITDINIASGASIATAKLANDLGITAAKIAPNAITTAKITDLTITTAKITDLNVTLPKLAIGAGLNNAVASATIIAFTQGAGGESQVVALPPFTPRGGRVFVFGTVAGFMTTTTTTASSATFKLFRDGLQIANALWTIDMQSEVASLRSVPVAFPLLWAEVPTVAAHTYSLRCAVASGGTAIFNSDGANGGMLFALEFA